jgi:hypothetical protein
MFNRRIIKRVEIEIDHINFGLGKKGLNKTARTKFTINDIKKFLKLLDGEELAADEYDGLYSLFKLRIDCPVDCKFKHKEFVMVFRTHYKKINWLHTITLFPNA